MNRPFVVHFTREDVSLYTNEMDLVLEIVEQVASTVPLEVLDEIGAAARRLETLQAFGVSDHARIEAARALDAARDRVPGFGLRFGPVTYNEAADLNSQLQRSLELMERVS